MKLTYRKGLTDKVRRYDYSQPVVLDENESEVEDSYGLPLEIPRRYEVLFNGSWGKEVEDEFDWQVTYKFSSRTRQYIFPGGRYGSKGMSLRRLYTILVSMNNGISFVDDYLVNVLPFTDLGRKIKEYAVNMSEAFEETFMETVRIRKDGKLDRRYLNRARLFRSMVESSVKSEGLYLAKLLKEDFTSALISGRVPLNNHILSKATVARKAKLGFPYPASKFVASGQFVSGILFYVRLEKKKWQTADIWA